jgi:hypothetical protein
MIWLLSLLASAGPLADGFRGQPWGTPFDSDAPPVNTSFCRPFVGKLGSIWTCPITIREIPFEAKYLYGRAGLMAGSVEPVGLGCATLRVAAIKAYGPGEPVYQHIATLDLKWQETGAFAQFEQKATGCRLSVTSTVVFDKHDAIERAAIPDGAL